MSEQPEKMMTKEQAEIFNRQACAMVSVFFKEIATFTPDQIFSMASKSEDTSTLLLETINRVFTQFIENGEGLPCVYFESYERTVDSLVHTFKLNIKNKLEANKELLIAQVVGKEEVTHTDIAKAIIVKDLVVPEATAPTEEM